MKKYLTLLLLLTILQAAVVAQDETAAASGGDEMKTLFRKSDKPRKLDIGFYIGPEGAWTEFDGRNVFLGGLSGGAILNHNFTVGLAAYGILNSRNLWFSNVDTRDSLGAYLYGGYGGFRFEYKLFPKAPVHLSFPLTIGGGGLVYNTWAYSSNGEDYDGSTLDWDAFFVVEPGVMLELNLVKFMRLDAGVSYRYTPDLDLMNTPAGLINKVNVNLSLKFGRF